MPLLKLTRQANFPQILLNSSTIILFIRISMDNDRHASFVKPTTEEQRTAWIKRIVKRT
jgi:hypothetical protein